MAASDGLVKLTAEQDIADKIAAARERLIVDEPKPSALAALSAAALAAMAAVVMAGVVVMGPGVQIDNPNASYTR